MLTPSRLLLAAYYALAVVMVLWNVSVASRIVQSRRTSRVFSLATAFGALLLIPAMLVAVSAASLVYGRAIQPVTWLWSLVTVLFLVQAGGALLSGRVNAALGVPVVVYDLIIAIVAITRYVNALGFAPPTFALVLSAATANALGLIGGTAALSQAAWLLIPMFSPALPSRARWRIGVRTVLSVVVTMAAALVLVEIPAATEAISSYSRFERDVPTERPDADFQFGLRILPILRAVPPQVALTTDLQLVDSLGVDAVSITVAPEAARGRALDSLAHVLDNVRGDSTTVIITLGYPRNARLALSRSPEAYVRERLADVNRLTRALRPTIFVPALEPYGEGARILGTRPATFWIDYISRAAGIAHYVNPNIRVGIAAASFGARDSTLYAWAASRTSPVDVPGFSLMAGFDGATSLDTRMRIARRWLSATPHPKPHWIWAAGGYPIVHGEESQRLALRGIFAWATAEPAVVGVVVAAATDYDTEEGLQGPSGHRRPALQELLRTMTTEREAGSAQ